MALVAALLGGSLAAGVLLALSAWRSTGTPRRALSRAARELLVACAVGVVAGALALAVTGWLVAGVALGIGAGIGWRSLRRRRPGAASEQARVEALATWCEQLRDLLAADQGIVGTIAATVRTCPEPLRGAVGALSSRLGRLDAATAIAQFADELDDPSGDLVAAVLLESTRRSSRTSELLSELAVTIRERAAMRLRVEAERAGHRSESRFVIGFSTAVVVGICVLGRDSDFLDAFDDGTGQLVLAIVAALFGGGIWWLGRLVRFERPARFLTAASMPGDGTDGTDGTDELAGGW